MLNTVWNSVSSVVVERFITRRSKPTMHVEESGENRENTKENL